MALHEDYLWNDLGMEARNRAPSTSWVSGAAASTTKQPPPMHPMHHHQQPPPPPPPPPPPQQQQQQPPPPQHTAVHRYHASQPLEPHHRPQQQPQQQPQPSSYLDASTAAVYPYSALESNTRQLPHPHPHPMQPRHLGQNSHLLNHLQSYEDPHLAPPMRHTPQPPHWAPQQQQQQRAYAPQDAKRHPAVAAYPPQPPTSAPYAGAYNTYSGYPVVHDDAKEMMDKALQECAPSAVSSDPLGLHKGRSSLLSSVSDDLHTMAGSDMPITFPSDPGADRGVAPPAYPQNVHGDTATSSSAPGGPPPQPPKVGVVGAIQKTKQRRRYAKPKSSRYCHLCARHERAVVMYPCGNLDLGICQKSVCGKCFEMYALDLAAAKTPRAPGLAKWTCPHCQNVCPKKAKCHSYDRQTERRRMKTLAAKMGMVRANGVLPGGTGSAGVVKREATSA